MFSVEQSAEWMGQSVQVMLETYSHLDKEQSAQAAKEMDVFISIWHQKQSAVAKIVAISRDIVHQYIQKRACKYRYSQALFTGADNHKGHGRGQKNTANHKL
jgi:hypothetical protein